MYISEDKTKSGFLSFEDIAGLVFDGLPLKKAPAFEEQACYLSMRHLYALYRSGEIGQGDAAQQKRQLKAEYLRALEEKEQARSVCRHYQENIRKTETLVSQIALESAQPGCDPVKLCLMACEGISYLTGQTAFYKAVRRNLERSGEQ